MSQYCENCKRLEDETTKLRSDLLTSYGENETVWNDAIEAAAKLFDDRAAIHQRRIDDCNTDIAAEPHESDRATAEGAACIIRELKR